MVRTLRCKTGARLRALLVSAFLCSCMSLERRGDDAARFNDWATAYASYSAAYRESPDDARIAQKYQHARSMALESATNRAAACSAAEDWPCAVTQLEFAYKVEPSSAALAVRLKDARTRLGFFRLAEAKAQADAGQIELAYTSLRAAREASPDAKLQADSASLLGTILKQVHQKIEELRSNGNIDEAIQVAEIAARNDARVSPLLASLRAERDRALVAAYEQERAAGDKDFAERRWSAALSHYRAAEAARAHGPAENRLRFCQAKVEAEKQVDAGKFSDAAKSLRAAIDTGEDPGRVAADELVKVEPAVYSIRVDRILVNVRDSSGQPWVRASTPWLGQVISLLGGPIAGQVITALEKLPKEQMPLVWASIALPDGRTLETDRQKGLYRAPGGTFNVRSNWYDHRALTIHVLGQGDRLSDAGTISVPLGDLIRNGAYSFNEVADNRLADQTGSLLGFKVTASRAGVENPFFFQDMVPRKEEGNKANSTSLPSPKSTACRISMISASISKVDYPNGTPDPYIKVRVGGKNVFQSAVAGSRFSGVWNPRETYLYLGAGDELTVELMDNCALGDVIQAAWTRKVNQYDCLNFVGRTDKGSSVQLEFENVMNTEPR